MLADLKRAFLDIPVADLFEICMKNNLEDISTYKQKRIQSQYKEFKERVLAKTKEINKHKNIYIDIEQYSGVLYDYQVAWLRFRKGRENFIDTFDKNYIKPFELAKLYSPVIKMLMINIESNCEVDIKITDIHDKSFRIKDQAVSNLLLKALVKNFKKLELNESRFTAEEAITFIKNPINREAVKEFSHVADLDFNTIDTDKPPQALIDKVTNSLVRPRDVTLDFLDAKIKELEKVNMKSPKPQSKIKYLAPLALDLSYLIRLESFILQDECDHIYNFSLRNKECELILEYFAFWKLVDLNNITSSYVYISTLINTYKKKRGPFDPINNYKPNEKAIDDLRIELRKLHYNSTPEV